MVRCCTSGGKVASMCLRQRLNSWKVLFDEWCDRIGEYDSMSIDNEDISGMQIAVRAQGQRESVKRVGNANAQRYQFLKRHPASKFLFETFSGFFEHQYRNILIGQKCFVRDEHVLGL